MDEVVTPRRRGRPSKRETLLQTEIQNRGAGEAKSLMNKVAAPCRRGRSSKRGMQSRNELCEASDSTTQNRQARDAKSMDEVVTTCKRGRPSTRDTFSQTDLFGASDSKTPNRQGRDAKSMNKVIPPRRRGRPSKRAAASQTDLFDASDSKTPNRQARDAKSMNKVFTTRRRGRPCKKAASTQTECLYAYDAETQNSESDSDESQESSRFVVERKETVNIHRQLLMERMTDVLRGVTDKPSVSSRPPRIDEASELNINNRLGCNALVPMDEGNTSSAFMVSSDEDSIITEEADFVSSLKQMRIGQQIGSIVTFERNKKIPHWPRRNLVFTVDNKGVEYAYYGKNDVYSLGYMRLRPKQHMPHKQNGDSTLQIILLSGKYKIFVNDDCHECDTGDAFLINKWIFYGIENTSDEIGLIMMLVPMDEAAISNALTPSVSSRSPLMGEAAALNINNRSEWNALVPMAERATSSALMVSSDEYSILTETTDFVSSLKQMRIDEHIGSVVTSESNKEMQHWRRRNLVFTADNKGVEYAYYDENDMYSIGYMRLKHKQRMPHKQNGDSTLQIFLLSGKYKIFVNDDCGEYDTGDALFIDKWIYYGIENTSDEIGLIVMVRD